MANKRITDLQLISAFTDSVNMPVDNGIQSYRGTAAQLKTYMAIPVIPDTSLDVENVGITATVAANALTITMTAKDGTALSVSNWARIAFRSSTLATGQFVQRTITSPVSLVISSGSTLGHGNAKPAFIFVYAIDTGAGVVLGASSTKFSESAPQSTTAEGGAGAADSASVIYSTAAQTTKSVRLIGRIRASQTTAGTWATAPTEIDLLPLPAFGRFVGAMVTGSTTSIPNNVGSGTVVSWATEALDPDNAMGATQFTCKEAGVYQVNFRGCSTNIGATAVGQIWYVAIMINTTFKIYGNIDVAYATTSRGYTSVGSGLLQVLEGDTIEMRCYHNMGASYAMGGNTVETHMHIQKISEYAV